MSYFCISILRLADADLLVLPALAIEDAIDRIRVKSTRLSLVSNSTTTEPTMLRSELIHPQISSILARAGHSSKVLIADGNYPACSAIGPKAELISLNLAPGLVTVAQVLKVLLTAIPIEAVNTMGMPEDDPYRLPHDPPVWNEYRDLLSAAGQSIELKPISRWDFYDAVESRDHVLTIQTGDQALWANLLLTIGVRKAGE